jgi:tRNA(adenine34) deaminase
MIAVTDAQRIQDEAGMRLALDQAHNAWLVGEVPVGAVILRDGFTSCNRPITTRPHRPCRDRRCATRALRPPAECELYVTLEPCAMLDGAAAPRFKRVVFSAAAPDRAAGSVRTCSRMPVNHRTD